MAHAQKPDFVFRRNGRVHLNRRGRQFSRLLAAELCESAVVIMDTPCSEVVWRVLTTHSIRQFPLHFPSRASPCAITFQLVSTLYLVCFLRNSPPPPPPARASSFTNFLDHTQRRTTVSRTLLDEWSDRRRPLPDNTQHSQQKDIHAPGGIRAHNLSKPAAADLRLSPRGRGDQRTLYLLGILLIL